MLITYSEIAHYILSGIILGILCAYSSHYVLLDTSWYCMFGAAGYLLYTLVKAVVRYRLQPSLSIKYIVVTCIVSCALGGVSFLHVNHQINQYVGHTKFFLSQEGEYALLIDSPVEFKVIDGKEYRSFSAILLGLVPHKDTAKGVHIKADGHIRVTIQENSTHLHMGDSIIVNGTPKSLYLTEERGTIDKRNKAIRNEKMGAIFDGTYKVVDLHALTQYKINSYIGYYQRWLYIIDSMRNAVEGLMQQYLSDTTKWLGIALVLGGHYWRIRPRCAASIWLHWNHSYFIYIGFPYCTVIFYCIWPMQSMSYQETLCYDGWYYNIYLLLYSGWFQCTCCAFYHNGDLAYFSLFKGPYVYGEARISSDGYTIFTI